MAGATDYLEKKILDHIFGGQVYTAPATLYVCLFTSAPSESGATFGAEVSGGGYTRKPLTNNNTNFPNSVSGSGKKYVGVEVLWSAASSTWGSVSHFGIADASTAGNLLVAGILNTPITVNTSDQVRVAAGEDGLTISCD